MRGRLPADLSPSNAGGLFTGFRQQPFASRPAAELSASAPIPPNDPTLIDWLALADLIVHEVTTMAHTGVHTPYEKLAALPANLRSRMRLTHLPDDFYAASSVIEPLHQGRCYVI